MAAGALAMSLGAFGCGDDDGDDGSGNPDASDGDGNEDAGDGDGTADAAPEGICDEADPFDCPEGGEVRFEYVRNTDTSNDDGLQPGAPQSRAVAFFLSAGEDYELPVIDNCYDLRDEANPIWPTAQDENREYVDVGNVIIVGGTEPLTLPKNPAVTAEGAGGTSPNRDHFFRLHNPTPDADPDNPPAIVHFEGGSWHYRPSGLGGGDTYSLPNQAYSVVLTGSDEWPTQFFEDAIWMPQEFTPTSQLTNNWVMPDGEALTVTWDVAEDDDAPTENSEAVVIAWTSGSTGPVYACVVENDGEFEVPADVVDAVRTALPTGGVFARQVVSHALQEFTNGDDVTDRRIDFIGVWCYVTNFLSSDPA